MYKVDGRDKVIPLASLPQCDVGAPLPVLAGGEGSLRLAYTSEEGPNGEYEVVTVTFLAPLAHMFGPPNDEAFSGHPLAARGLTPYGAFTIKNSSWVRGLERMNSVHPNHRRERYEQLNHYVLSFHDSTFECVAEGMVHETSPASRALVVEAHPH